MTDQIKHKLYFKSCVWVLVTGSFFLALSFLYFFNWATAPHSVYQPILFLLAGISCFLVTFIPQEIVWRASSVFFPVVAAMMQTISWITFEGAVESIPRVMIWGYLTLTLVYALPRSLPPPVTIKRYEELVLRSTEV